MERILGWAIVPIVMAAAAAHAQTGDAQAEDAERQRCSSVPAKASAAEQALCWFEESESASGEDTALRQAAAWCQDAALDDPRVAHACFVAPLRLGRLDEAHGLTEYLRDPSDYAQKCKDALTGLMEARVVTDPKGARIVVGGQTYGRSPVTVRLQSPWWQQTITARFDGHEVQVGAGAIKDAFDERVCEMGDVVIEQPEAAADQKPAGTGARDGAQTDAGASETASAQHEAGTQGTAATAPTSQGAQLNTAGWITTGTGAALLAGAAALGGLALGERNDLESVCGVEGLSKDQCEKEEQSKIDGIEERFNRYKVTAWSLFGVGVAVAGTGVLLLVLEGSNSESPDVAADLQCGLRGCIGGVRGRF